MLKVWVYGKIKKKKKVRNLTKWKLQPFIIIWIVPGEQGKKLFTMAPGCVKTANWMKLKKKIN